jgi:hypothetical protein
MWSAGILTAGMFLVDAIAPVKMPSSTATRQSYEDSPTYSVSAPSNQMNPWGVVPRILGRHKVYPPLGAKSYTEIIGSDEYLRMLVVWGYGPASIEDLKIGDTPLSSFDNVELEVRAGWSTDTDITLFPGTVNQETVNVILSSVTGRVERTAQVNADELSVDVTFPRGLVSFGDDGSRVETTVDITIEYRELPDGEWTEIPSTRQVSVSGTKLWVDNPPLTGLDMTVGTNSVYASNPEGVIYSAAGVAEIEGSYRIGEYSVLAGGVIASVTDLSPEGVTGLVCTAYRNYLQVIVAITVTPGSAGTTTNNNVTFIDKTTSAVRRGFRWAVDPEKSYEVGITRDTADTEDDTIIDEVYWTYLRSITSEYPINFPHPLAITALRIKATDQLNGMIDNLNGVVTSWCPVWDSAAAGWGTEENDYAPTSNPAALIRHVLMGTANARARTAAQVDDAALGEFYDFCGENGYAFNMYRDYAAGVFETCKDIASVARGNIIIKDGLWSVIADTGQQTLVQHITPRNSWGFSAQKVLFNKPHAFRIRFKNEDNDYADDERIVYDDGYTSENATFFESIEFPGITDPDLIWKFGRYHIAQARLRPEIYTLYQDFEHLVCRRGDMVRVSHDVPMWGNSWGRVKSLTTDGGNITHITLDESVTMEAETSYACRFRLADGNTLILSIVLDVGETPTLELQTPVAEALGPEVDDLAMFGEADSETVRLLVHSIQRAGEFTAQLFLVDVATAIYDADTGEIPEFDPQTTGSVDITTFVPDCPTITDIIAGTDTPTTSGGGSISTLTVHLAAPSNDVRIRGYRVRYRLVDESQWQYTQEMPNLTILISSVIEDAEYEIQAQSISVYGVASTWTATGTGTPATPQIVPAHPTGISAEMVAGGSAYDYAAVHVTFTPPSTSIFSHCDIYASNDDSVYYYVGQNTTGSFVFSGLGSIYEAGDTCYIKLRSVSTFALAEDMPDSYDASVAVNSYIRLGSFYAGTNDFWGGNAALGNAATTIVLGDLKSTPKIALGPSADSISVTGTAPGFIADGTGKVYFGDGDSKYFKFDGTNISWKGVNAELTAAGELTVSNIAATGGTIGGWTIAATTLTGENIVLDSGNDRIVVDGITIDGANNRIRSSNYVSGFLGAGFTLEPDLLEVGNASIRGIIRTSVFEYNSISVHSGSDLTVKGGDVLAEDMTAADNTIF